MKRFLLLLALMLTTLTTAMPIFAHGNNDHVRGTVTAIGAGSITVQTTAKATKTLTLTDKTTFKMAGKAAKLTDLKVGDRVVVDVPKGSNVAEEIQIGAAAAATK